MLNTLKLKGRILLGYSVPIAIMLTTAVFVYHNVNKVNQESQEVESSHQIVDDLKDIAFSISDMQRAARGYLIEKNASFLQAYEKDQQLFLTTADDLSRTVEDGEQQRILREIIDLGNQVDVFNRQVINLVTQNQKEKATEQWKSGESQALSEKLDQLVLTFETKEAETLRTRQQNEADGLSFLTQLVIVSTLLSAILAIVMGLWIASRISQTIQNTVNTITSSSSEIAAAVGQQERSAVQQATAINQTTSTMDELGASSRQAAEQAESAAAGANAIAQQVVSLSEQVKQINTISSLVSDLANQTNMLALNAAVEAARAGDHGKGFAVVAGEIRKLADESKKSAEKIKGLVSDIQRITDTTVVEIGDATRVESIVAAVTTIVTNNQQIFLTAKQQAIAIQQVVDAMNALNLSARETASSISQTKVSTHQLNEAAQNLQAVV